MDEILKIFVGGSSDEESEGTAGSGFSDGGQGRSFGGRNQSLPGGGGVWEFEMPAGGIQEWQNSQQGSVYNVPAPPANNSPQSLQNLKSSPDWSHRELSLYPEELLFPRSRLRSLLLKGI